MPDQADPARLSPFELAAADAVDLPYLVGLLSELIEIPSVGGDESAAQQRMAEEMENLGLEVDAWDIDLDEMKAHPDYSAEVDRTRGRGVVAVSGTAGPRLMLNGHVDVVPVGDTSRWTVPPWRATVTADQVFGRGACDMKGGLACALAAIRAVAEAGVDLAGSVALASVIGEEDGGLGTLAVLQRGHSADAAVVMEPTNESLAVSQAGALGFRLVVPGAPAHGALRTEGVSAVDAFIPVLEGLHALERRRNGRFRDPLFAAHEVPLALSVGTVRAGEWSSTVPDRLVAEGRYGVAPGEDPAAARREFEEAVAEICVADSWLREHPVDVEWWGGRFHPAAIEPGEPVVRQLEAVHAAVAGVPAPIVGVPYGTDARHLVNTGGIPTVLYGPGDPRHAHREDEVVPIAQLQTVAQALAALIVRFCGTRP